MDKNTLTGLLLMGLVLFGFMYCNRDNNAAQQSQQQTEQNAVESKKSNSQNEVSADPATQLRQTLMSMVQQKGSAIEGDTTGRARQLVDKSMQLVTDANGSLSGTITVKNVSYNVADVLDAKSTAMTAEQRAQAIGAINASFNYSKNFGAFANFAIAEASKPIVVDNGKMRVTFDAHGGRIAKVELLDYKTETTETPTNIVMFNSSTADYAFEFETDQHRISTKDLYFKPQQLDKNTVLMALPVDSAAGVMLGIKYTVSPDDYIVKMDIVQQGLASVIPSSRKTMKFNWDLKMARNEKGRTFEEQKSALYYKVNDESPEDLDSNSDESEDVNGSIKWVAFKNQFFSSVIIPRNTFSGAKLDSKVLKNDPDFLKTMSLETTFDYSSSAAAGPGFDFYFGPNDYSILSSLDEKISPDNDLELTRLIPMGWGIFRWINKFVIVPVFNFLSFIPNYGIVILLLTLFIKLILFPFTYKSYISQAKMRVLAPEIKEINEKYPGNENAMKRQQETMKLYSKAGASPFSGCLPMLLQMPVLIAMFWFFPSAIELRGQSFLWVHDLSAPDFICTLPFTIPFYGNHVSLFCLLMTVVNIVYTRINMQNQPGGTSMPGMKWMMYLMPVMFLFFFNDYAAALSYYYFLSLLITIVQTWIFRRVINEDKVRAQMLENAKKPRKKSGFMARLEAAQKQQEAMMREQAKQRAARNNRR